MNNKTKILLNEQRPIFIFGINDLSLAALKLVWSIDKSPVAFVDNNADKCGKKISGIPVLSPDSAFKNADNAVVLICTLNPEFTNQIIHQISSYQIDLIYFTADEIMQEYITHVRNDMKMQDVFAKLKKGDCNFVERYSYSVACDFDTAKSDIYGIANCVSGIVYMEIRIESEKITKDFIKFITQISILNNVLLIIVKTDLHKKLSSAIVQDLKKYISCIKFYNYPPYNERNPLQSDFLDLERLHLPFTYIHKNEYPRQEIGLSPKPLTKNDLRDVVCNYIDVPNTFKKEYDKKVCIVKLAGGLGNNILDYLSMKIVSYNSLFEIVIDNTSASVSTLKFNECARDTVQFDRFSRMGGVYFKKSELCEVFGSDFALLSDLFSDEEWCEYIRKVQIDSYKNPVLDLLALNDFKMSLITSKLVLDREYNIANQFLANPTQYLLTHTYPWKDVPYIYLGSMENAYYFQQFAGNPKSWNKINRIWAQDILKFPQIQDEYNQKMETDMLEHDAVAIHIRRGDMADAGYFNSQVVQNFESYFETAIASIESLSEYSNKHYYIFSDDIDWCKEHEKELGIDTVHHKTTYVAGNTGKNCFRDMLLMSKGKIIVMCPSSTFSVCAFILSSTVEKYVCFTDFQLLCDTASQQNPCTEIIKTAD